MVIPRCHLSKKLEIKNVGIWRLNDLTYSQRTGVSVTNSYLLVALTMV
ncbi:protein of unknown function [Candidatus Nitrosotalea okcheonensis]|uniref:Uncharacterized protein n=1 Tax=Candidatus Nitrosotalea okcheonensis TaxID=1903276 RepID=A0A2H1FFF3_9ARCH|nr:protein of unknown function [Candidatus Nitrosotalea okcheonensis]